MVLFKFYQVNHLRYRNRGLKKTDANFEGYRKRNHQNGKEHL